MAFPPKKNQESKNESLIRQIPFHSRFQTEEETINAKF